MLDGTVQYSAVAVGVGIGGMMIVGASARPFRVCDGRLGLPPT
jgi:hypothetical protein